MKTILFYLVLTFANGESAIVDHGLTAEDCEAMAADSPVLSCEAEPEEED
jgi:hypothetical protein